MRSIWWILSYISYFESSAHMKHLNPHCIYSWAKWPTILRWNMHFYHQEQNAHTHTHTNTHTYTHTHVCARACASAHIHRHTHRHTHSLSLSYFLSLSQGQTSTEREREREREIQNKWRWLIKCLNWVFSTIERVTAWAVYRKIALCLFLLLFVSL